MSRLKGFKHTEESKKKMSLWQIGKHHSPTTEIKKGQHISIKTEFKKGRKIPKEISEKWSKNRKGSGNPNWKGGKTKLILILRTSKQYKLWRTAVFERDNYTCIWCGLKGNQTGGYLEADHIKPFAYYPELRFAIDNGRTLCRECHKKTDTYKNRKP